jgi:hypothetical protein
MYLYREKAVGHKMTFPNTAGYMNLREVTEFAVYKRWVAGGSAWRGFAMKRWCNLPFWTFLESIDEGKRPE